MLSYKPSHLDGLTIFEKEHRAQVLAKFLAHQTLLGIKVPYTNYDDAKEFVNVRFIEYIYAQDLHGSANQDQLLDFRAREIALINQAGKRLPYHTEYPSWWTQFVLGTPLHEIGGAIAKELEHFARITRTYYKFQFSASDQRYLLQILETQLRIVEENASKQKVVEVELERLQSAVLWFSTELTLDESETVTSVELPKSTPGAFARARKGLDLTLDDCLIHPRFTVLELNALLLNIGLVEYNQEGRLKAQSSTMAWQWAVVRAVLSDKAFFRKVSHSIAAKVFVEAYGAKVGRETMGMEINKREGKAKTPAGALYAELLTHFN